MCDHLHIYQSYHGQAHAHAYAPPFACYWHLAVRPGVCRARAGSRAWTPPLTPPNTPGTHTGPSHPVPRCKHSR